jgi:UDP-glucose 4-epimerase
MILVIGGAGYIGSHVIEELIKTNDVLVMDNLSTGHREAVPHSVPFIKGDLNNEVDIENVFRMYPISAVMHFAANSLVGESVINPLKYYENNVSATLRLLKVMIKYNVNKFIFSSTAATYGVPKAHLITEESPTNPINPYGRSKLMMENILADFAAAYDFRYIILRYFNAAGASSSGRIGEKHNPETHLIPIVMEHLLGKRDFISIFGDDYDTPDGTCIRDYIHVSDLASAHIVALNSLINNTNTAEIYNLGNGQGYSVKEVIETCEKVTGLSANIKVVARRKGDPARLVASALKIEKELNWSAQKDLVDIVQSAWRWHSNMNKK